MSADIHNKRVDRVIIFDNYAKAATNAYLAVMISIFPLFTGLSGYIGITEKKFFFFSVITLGWLLFLIGLTIYCQYRPSRYRGTICYILIILFLLGCIVSTINSPYANFFSIETGRCDGLFTWLLYGCMFIGVIRFGTPHRQYIYIAAGAYLINCTITILQLCGLNPLWLYPNKLNYYEPFVQELCPFLGTLGNIDVGSAWHCLLIPIMCAEIVTGEKREKYFLLIPVVLGMTSVVATKVASGVLALAITFSLYLPVWAAYTASTIGRAQRCIKVRNISALIVGVCWITGLGIIYLNSGLPGTLGELHNLLHGKVNDDFGSSRVLIWKETVKVFRNNVIFGVGPDSLSNYLDIHFSRYSEALGQLLQARVDNAHNEYLQILVSFGVIGFLPLTCLMTLTFRKVFRQGIKPPYTQLLPSMLCYMIQAFFNIGLCIVAPLFIIIWALILSENSTNK